LIEKVEKIDNIEIKKEKIKDLESIDIASRSRFLFGATCPT